MPPVMSSRGRIVQPGFSTTSHSEAGTCDRCLASAAAKLAVRDPVLEAQEIF